MCVRSREVAQKGTRVCWTYITVLYIRAVCCCALRFSFFALLLFGCPLHVPPSPLCSVACAPMRSPIVKVKEFFFGKVVVKWTYIVPFLTRVVSAEYLGYEHSNDTILVNNGLV